MKSGMKEGGRWKGKKQRCYLPHEIIEMILSRLPAKDLLRLRVVSKQWEATISDPTFAEIHLHLQRYSPRKLLALPNLHHHGYNGMHVVELQNNSMEFVSAIEYNSIDFVSAIESGLEKIYVVSCSCDGLYLTYIPNGIGIKEGESRKCQLWNPSRRMYRELYFPPSIRAYGTDRTVHGMYHDPLKKDYKIVIADMKHYAVYSCRDNRWGDVKEMKGFLGELCEDPGVFFNGSIYWMIFDIDWMESKYRFIEVICYDCNDESFKSLPLPNYINRKENHFQLASLGGKLCLFISERKSLGLKIMIKVSSAQGNDKWTESKEFDCLCKCSPDYGPILEGLPLTPVCQMSENELLFHVWIDWKLVYMLYDKSKNTVVEIHSLHNHSPNGSVLPVSHFENLLLL